MAQLAYMLPTVMALIVGNALVLQAQNVQGMRTSETTQQPRGLPSFLTMRVPQRPAGACALRSSTAL